VKDQTTKEPASVDLMNKVIGHCKSQGLIIGKNGDTVAGFNNVLTLAPPLCLTEDDFKFMVKTLKEAIVAI
jgi:4-aminobutyrate aminotransferase-like enzyme